VELPPTVPKEVSTTLETKSRAANKKSGIKKAVVMQSDLSGYQQPSVKHGDITRGVLLTQQNQLKVTEIIGIILYPQKE
jgi:hypothetical protein